MKSFGSSLGRGGNATSGLNNTNTSVKDLIVSSFKSALSEGLAGKVSDEAIQGVLKDRYDDNLNSETIEYLSNQSKIDLSFEKTHQSTAPIVNYTDLYNNYTNTALYEDQIKFPSHILNSINNYKYIFKHTIDLKADISVLAGTDVSKPVRDNTPMMVSMHSVIGSPALFNPFFAVNANGINPYTPLLHANIKGSAEALVGDFGGGAIPGEGTSSKYDLNTNVQDCSIQTLVKASQININHQIASKPLEILASRLGLARYKYADFMFCKDLGKVSNNHLITLRRFAHPVGDDIFTGANNTKKMNHPEYGVLLQEQEPDLARLVCWFGTGDNQLENIMKYDYSMSWKELHAQIQEMESKEDDHNSLLGAFVNSTSGGYNLKQAQGMTGGNNLISMLAGRSKGALGKAFSTDGYQDRTILRNYDKNKVYEPRNTIQDTVIYEGKLQFQQEFSLVFSYKMRQYSNINTKSAFLDLIGNILETTYRRGVFWQGGRKIIGANQSSAGWHKVNGYVNNAWDKMTSFGESLLRGNIDMGSIFASASEMVSKAYEGARNQIGQALANPKETGNALADAIAEFNKKTHFSEALKGQLLNKLGRPMIYAWDSYLNGENVGLWHVTIGNPFNPIAAFGNLIITGASIQHMGPLGIDDFPTEIKVTVNLKHARSRDITEIGKMYTKGFSSIYSLSGYRIKSLYYNDNQNADNAKANDAKMLKYEQERVAQERESEKIQTERTKINQKYQSKVSELQEKYKAKEAKDDKDKKRVEAENKANAELLNKELANLRKQEEDELNKYPYPDTPPQIDSESINSDVFYGTLGTDDYTKMIAISDEVA